MMVIRKQLIVEAPAERAYRVFSENMGLWWPREHHIGGSPLKDCIVDHEFLARVREPLQRAYHMNLYMQRCFRELCREDCDLRSAGFPVASDPIRTKAPLR